MTVDTDRGRLRAQHIVVTTGAWSAGLLPGLKHTLVPIRQTVAYVDTDVDAAALPVWAWRGEGDFFYGLPEFQRPGLKAAKHVVEASGDDPDGDPGPPDVTDVLAFLGEHLAAPPRAVLAVERCLYTVAPNEDFILDHHPASRAVVVGVGMSGHGFKFGPLTGRILAELTLDGKTTVAPFEAARARFGWR